MGELRPCKMHSAAKKKKIPWEEVGGISQLPIISLGKTEAHADG